MRRRRIIPLLLTICIMSGCAGHVTHHNLKADDAISHAIYARLGNDVYYQGKQDFSNTELYYEYLIQTEDSEWIHNMVEVVNSTIKQENITERIDIVCMSDIPGGSESVMGFSNYSDWNLGFADYETMRSLSIMGTDMSIRKVYDNPEIYANIQGISHLKVAQKIQDIAEEKNIQWSEYWPELEYFHVATDNKITKELCGSPSYDELCHRGRDNNAGIYHAYKYIIMNNSNRVLGDIINTINPVIKREKINEPVSIAFYSEEKIGEAKKIVRLSNYADEEEPSAEYEGIQVLTIYGKAEDGEDYFYNNPSVYAGLPGIKYLKVSAAIQERAQVQNIDWHEYWPELEMVEVLE